MNNKKTLPKNFNEEELKQEIEGCNRILKIMEYTRDRELLGTVYKSYELKQ